MVNILIDMQSCIMEAKVLSCFLVLSLIKTTRSKLWCPIKIWKVL